MLPLASLTTGLAAKPLTGKLLFATTSSRKRLLPLQLFQLILCLLRVETARASRERAAQPALRTVVRALVATVFASPEPESQLQPVQ